MILLAGCASVTNTFNKSSNIDANLPTISYDGIKFISDNNSIALEWKVINDPNVLGYNIYRANEKEGRDGLKKIATLNNKYTAHYLDKDLKPATNYLYAISIISINKTQSNLSRPLLANTFEGLASISYSLAIGELPRQIKILWRPHDNQAIEYYIIQRNDPKNLKWKTVAKIKNRLNAEYIDTSLKDDYTYTYRIKVLTHDNILSYASKQISAKTKALPKAPNITAVSQDLPNKILLKWLPFGGDEIKHYNIYSSKSENGSYSKVISAKRNDDIFEHILNRPDEVRYYKITSVDNDGLETSKDTVEYVIGKTLQRPKVPQLTLALIKNNVAMINWDAGDNIAIYYNVYKYTKKSLFNTKKEKFEKINSNSFTDSNIVKGVKYIYKVEAVDSNDLASLTTNEILLTSQ